MRISKIELENYRPFKDDDNEIKLSTSSEKNINVIEGENGAGKTTILQALIWCLYGEEPNKHEITEDEASPIINKKLLHEDMDVGEKRRVRVRVRLDNPKPVYRITRIYLFEKTEEGADIVGEEFSILEKDGDWSEIEQEKRKDVVNSLLPKAIMDYFFFDGEKLDKFFRAGSKEDVKETVFNVSQIFLLEQSIRHLKRTANEVSREFDGELSGKIEEKTDEIEEKEKEKEEKEGELEELDKKIQELRKAKKDIDRELESVAGVKDLHSERNELEKEYEGLEDREDEIKNNIKGLIIDNLPVAFAKDALETCLEEIENLDEDFGLPPNIRESYIKMLLDTEECICGTHLGDKTDEREQVKHALEEEPSNQVTELGLDGKYAIQSVIEGMSDTSSNAKNYNKEWTKVADRMSEISDRTTQISTTLKNINQDLDGDKDLSDVEELEEERENLDDKVEDKSIDKGKLKGEIEKLEEKIGELEDERDDLQNETGKNEDQKRKMKALKRSRNLLQEVKEDIMSEIRSEIASQTNKQFFELIWKEEYEKVKISEDYSVEVIDKYGDNVKFDLSKGERQALALAFMAALKQVSGYDFPVTIDTPLGRISGRPKENIANKLPGYLEETQLNLLVTDEEYTDEFRENIQDRIGSKYFLESDKEEATTEVIYE